MSQTFVKLYMSVGNLRYRCLRAKRQHLVHRAIHFVKKTIEVGERYYRFYVLKDTKLFPIGNFPESQISHCDCCGVAFIDYKNNQRFCCVAHGQEHFRRESVGAEDKTFWGDY